MLEALLTSRPSAEEQDDHDLAFPAGTPFKGVVRSRDFINGTTLATRIGLTAGTAINNESGWLHFVEDNGYNIYIAKKPLRHALTWASIDQAQQGKEIILGGKTFLVDFMTGMAGQGLDPGTPSNGGGQWNRYMYNIYNGERVAELPVTKENWGPYDSHMLGIPLGSEDKLTTPGAMSHVKEVIAGGQGGGHALRGVQYPGTTPPNIAGVWYTNPEDVGFFIGWRPMLYEKGTSPPVPVTPFKGEVLAADFINATALAAAIGLVPGTVTNNTSPWLKFIDNGKTFYMPKMSIRNNITHEQLEALGAVKGTKTIVIGGLTYKVRLMTGLTADPGSVGGGEYNDYFTRVTNQYTPIGNAWASYTMTDIGWTGSTGNNELTLIQEFNASYGGWATRGYPGFGGVWYQIANTTHAGYGWRPVLELVP
jgi:hypothetical protein